MLDAHVIPAPAPGSAPVSAPGSAPLSASHFHTLVAMSWTTVYFLPFMKNSKSTLGLVTHSHNQKTLPCRYIPAAYFISPETSQFTLCDYQPHSRPPQFIIIQVIII